MLGLSRLGYALARQPPDPVAASATCTRAAARRWWSSCIGAVLAIALLIPADLEFLRRASARSARRSRSRSWRSSVMPAALHASPTATGRTRCRFNVPHRPRRAAAAGRRSARSSRAVAFVSVLVSHGGARWVGRRLDGLRRARSTSTTAPRRASRSSSASPCPRRRSRARRRRPSTARSSCRCSATPLDDDIMQTAGRLAAEENEDVGEGGAVIEALWVFEVPMALPLDARVPDEELKRARARRSRAPRRWGRSTRASRSPRRSCARAAPARRSCTRPSAAASRRSCSPPRSRPACAAACASAASRGCATRSWARRPATWSRRRPAG